MTTAAPVSALWDSLRTSEPPDLCQEPRAGTLSVAEVTARVRRGCEGWAGDDGRLDRVLAAALLYHDHYNEAHDLVQDMTDPDGSLVHALVHRREPDYWNANYWYRRVGDHALYRHLTRRLATMRPPGPAGAVADRLVLSGTLDPMALVAACEDAAALPPRDPVAVFLRALQDAEFELLVGLLASSAAPCAAARA